MTEPTPDVDYFKDLLLRLLETPSPAGYTGAISAVVCAELESLGIPHALTRRGSIRADLAGRKSSPDRAIVSHLDTIGAQVKALKPNGRLRIRPIGTWSSRCAEGARVRVFTDRGARRGTVLPLKASGHIWGDEVSKQPVDWTQVEVRLEERTCNREHLEELGVHVGDLVGFDAEPRISASGFVSSRHLDDKGGVAATLAAAKAVMDAGITPPVDCHLLFTITEEVGSGASYVLHRDVAEMVAVDTAPQGHDQTSNEFQVSIGMGDATGPFDYHLTHHLIDLAGQHAIRHQRDVFDCYRSDAASALEAGNDIRTALVCFGTDATHGWERTHLDALGDVTRLLAAYIDSPPAVLRDQNVMGSLEGFPIEPMEDTE